MSRNPSIQEGGATKTASNVNRLVTALQAGGVCYWVPEDEHMLMTKYAPKNGLYLPADDGVFAFSKVTVNVPGGAPGMDVPTLDENGDPMPSPTDPSYDPTVPTYGPVQVDPTTPSTEIPAIPGGPGSSISGIDPTTGGKAVAKVGENGDISIKAMPTIMKITTVPRKTSYTEGDKMDYTGIVCQLFVSEEDVEAGNPFTDEKYPDGVIPFSELMFPIEEAYVQKSDIQRYRNREGSLNAILVTTHMEYHTYSAFGKTHRMQDAVSPPFFTLNGNPAALLTGYTTIAGGDYFHGGIGSMWLTKYDDGGGLRLYAALESGSDILVGAEYIQPSSLWPDGGWGNEITSTWHPQLKKFKRHPSESFLAFTAPISTIDPEEFDLKDLVSVGTMIPVQWLSPYDGQVHTDEFEVEVTEKETQPGGGDSGGEWSGSGGGDFGGGGGAGTGF